jgi:hypothetical protein
VTNFQIRAWLSLCLLNCKMFCETMVTKMQGRNKTVGGIRVSIQQARVENHIRRGGFNNGTVDSVERVNITISSVAVGVGRVICLVVSEQVIVTCRKNCSRFGDERNLCRTRSHVFVVK